MPSQSLFDTRSNLLRAMLGQDNQAAWTEFVERYRPMIERWCRDRGLLPNQFDDVLSFTLERVFRHLDRYDATRGRFRGWLKTMVDRLVKDLLREQRRKAEQRCSDLAKSADWLEQLPDPCSLEDLAEDTGQQVQQDLLHDQLMALRRVRARTKRRVWKAFWRTTVKGEPTPQVAAALGMQPAAVSKAKFRIRQKVLEEFRRLRGPRHP